MTASLEEALGLFKKWESESLPVIAFGDSDGFAVVVSGTIVEVTPTTIVLARKGSESDNRSAQIIIGILAASHFEYLDARETPQNVQAMWGKLITGALGIHLPNSLWVFQELGGTR
jgi:hypothetical protein